MPSRPARTDGFFSVLHTWDQRLQHHPHVAELVGTGMGHGLDTSKAMAAQRFVTLSFVLYFTMRISASVGTSWNCVSADRCLIPSGETRNPVSAPVSGFGASLRSCVQQFSHSGHKSQWSRCSRLVMVRPQRGQGSFTCLQPPLQS